MMGGVPIHLRFSAGIGNDNPIWPHRDEAGSGDRRNT